MYKFGQTLYIIDECTSEVKKCIYIGPVTDEELEFDDIELDNIVVEGRDKIEIAADNPLFTNRPAALKSLIEVLEKNLSYAKHQSDEINNLPKVHELFEGTDLDVRTTARDD